MLDRNVDLEYRKSDASAPVKITANSNANSQFSQPSVKAIAMGPHSNLVLMLRL